VLYPKAIWAERAAEIRKLPTTRPEVREYRRQMFANVSEQETDKQGRIIIPTTCVNTRTLTSKRHHRPVRLLRDLESG